MPQAELFEIDVVRRFAQFSPCRTYRYRLEIRWGAGRAINFLMLNPSTADEVANDPTVERCERRARMWGYPALIVTNLFAYRSTDPEAMKTAGRSGVDVVGTENDHHIVQAYAESIMTVAAWGVDGEFQGRGEWVMRKVLGGMPLKCLRQSKHGHPCHPLYLSYRLEPIDLKRR